MKKLILIITGLISACFALFIITLVYLVNLDPNEHKAWISEQFYQQTGRELSITGNIENSFYPWLGLQVEGLEISNPPGFSDELFLHSDFAAFRIKFLPLLSQNYEIDTVLLRGTSVNLEVNAQGNNNWGFAGDVEAENTDNSATASPSMPFNQLIIGGVQVEDVSISYANSMSGQQISASDIEIRIPALVYGEALDISMSLLLSANEPALESELSINSLVTYDLDNNNYALENLRLDFLDSRLLASLASNDGDISGSLEFSTERGSELLALAGQEALAEQLRSISLSTTLSGNTERLNLNPFELTLALSDATLRRPSTVNLAANAQIDLDNENMQVNSFTLNALDLNAQGFLAIEDFQSDPRLNGEIRLVAFNPKTLADLLRIELPETRDTAVLEHVAFSTGFRSDANSAALENLSLELDQSLIQGSSSINRFDAPDYSFNLNVDSIDLDRYLAPETSQSPAAAETGDAELPLDTLRELALDGTITITSLLASGLSLNDVVLSVNADEGLIALNPVQANLYEGSFAGSLSLDARPQVPEFSLQSNLQGINLAPLSDDFIGASYLSGQGNINLALNGSGLSSQTILANLNGNAMLSVADGIFYGVDVGAVLAQLETMLQSRRLLAVNQGEQTSFDNLSASIQIENGIARSNDLLIQSPGFNITGRGTLANLQNNTLDFNLLTSVNSATASVESEQYDIGGYSLPIACTGNMNSPRCLPDVNAIFNQAVGNLIRDEVGGLLERVLGGNNEQNNTTEPAADDEEAPEENEDSAQQLFDRALESLFR